LRFRYRTCGSRVDPAGDLVDHVGRRLDELKDEMFAARADDASLGDRDVQQRHPDVPKEVLVVEGGAAGELGRVVDLDGRRVRRRVVQVDRTRSPGRTARTGGGGTGDDLQRQLQHLLLGVTDL
jgi:hypothetical protein